MSNVGHKGHDRMAMMMDARSFSCLSRVRRQSLTGASELPEAEHDHNK
ncbi:MAG: hypothetical protein RH945_05560 [Hyphomonas sp.]